jgi:hypothetical protein
MSDHNFQSLERKESMEHSDSSKCFGEAGMSSLRVFGGDIRLEGKKESGSSEVLEAIFRHLDFIPGRARYPLSGKCVI